MKKSNRLLIKIGLMFIFLCFLCIILCRNVVSATTTPELAIGETVRTNNELWEKTKSHGGLDIYCIQPHTNFKGGNYKVKEKWEIEGDIVKYNGSIVADTNKKKSAFIRAYILSEKDPEEQKRLEEAFKICRSWDSNSQRVIKNGIYDVLSYKQEAFWMSEGEGFWRNNGSKLEYYWDLVGDGQKSKFGISRISR